MSADPLAVHAPGEPDLNLFAYVLGRVLQNIDPLGLECAEAAGGSCNTGTGASQGQGNKETSEQAENREQGREAGLHDIEINETAKMAKFDAEKRYRIEMASIDRDSKSLPGEQADQPQKG